MINWCLRIIQNSNDNLRHTRTLKIRLLLVLMTKIV